MAEMWVAPSRYRSAKTRAHRVVAVVNDRTRTACGRVFQPGGFEATGEEFPRCDACLLVGDVSDPRRAGLRCGRGFQGRAA